MTRSDIPGNWTRRRKRQRAVFTAVDYTRAQTTSQLAGRLRMDPATVYRHLRDLEATGAVIVSGRPLAWRRPAVAA